MVRISHVALGALILIAGSSSLSARSEMRVTLTAGPIVDALRAAGVDATSNEVEFLASVPASHSDVALRVTGWRKLDAATVWVRLMCRRAQDCLPFFILLHSASPEIASSFHNIPPPGARAAAAVRKTRGPRLIRAGSPATLLLNNGATRIRTSVICLDSGERGSRIRVRSLATKRVLSAEIIDRGLVQAWF